MRSTLCILALASAAVADQPTILWSADAHNQPIRAVAYSPDGLLIATASEDHTVKLWNAHTGAPLGTVATHYDKVSCLAFSFDGAYLATGGQDSLIHVIRMADRHELYTTGMGGTVEGLAFFHDGSAFAASLGYFERDQVQFRTSDGEPIAIIRHHWGTVWSVATSDNGSYLATCGADSRVLVYSAPETPLLDLGGHEDDVIVVRFSPDSSLLASAGSYDHTILLHHMPDGALAHSIDVPTAPGIPTLLHGVSFSPDNHYLAAAAEEWPVRGRIDIYRVSDGTLAHQYTDGTGLSVGAIAYAPDGSAYAFGRADGRLIIAANPDAVGACYANCDGSTAEPVLNVQDFSCFLNKFASGDPYANCDGSITPPILNIQDFSCFLNRFATGCP